MSGDGGSPTRKNKREKQDKPKKRSAITVNVGASRYDVVRRVADDLNYG